ncbi:TIR domain-containing protein [Solirubrobacter ginsenosidimutans]|uniref:TIR domain-containing protein n=1 Tax=Solirubrobacter ginsenosidimutans TaxID=490573 RepID=A0A9X3MR13_9ACTN|nr:TIR domain-containing protein [Solirubrobacter ginsenosidimutans]MDA0160301.1 TIR domain-containing protein [Solirubrobacter ginsenosidimutans]
MSVASTDLGQPPTAPTGPRCFVSYRRSDSPSAARQIADALTARFGAENVFFDTRDLRAGTDWHRDITERVNASDVIVAVIGPQWVAIADERGRRRVLQPEEEDVVRTEIEAALRSGGRVVPVLVDDAALPARDVLPRPFRPITTYNAVTLRHATWERDLEALVDALAVPPPVEAPAPAALTAPAEEWEPRAGGPPESHYRRIAKALSRGMLVPVIGAGVYSPAQAETWVPGSGRLPNASELARALSERFGRESQSADLAEVAQQVLATEGPKPLERALRDLLLNTPVEPSPIHHALARWPALLRAAECESFPLLVTTTYDTGLERAFERAGEPFDLAVCIASGNDRGRFLHIPWYDVEDRAIEPIARPNEYVEFPIDDYGDLSRTIILKVHGGAVHDAPPGLKVPTGFLVTEDDYIGFLSESPAENLVPAQLLNKLRESHFLFLGYGVREWSLRVFLRRVWHDGGPGATSWAVQAGTDELDDDFWRTLEVERFDASPVDYLADLQQLLRG